MADFGAVLRRLREQTGLKQKEVAKAMGTPQPVLSRLETGNQSPRDRRMVIDLAAAMDLSPTQTDELLEAAGFQVLLHSRIPCNDAGISYGQVVEAAAQLGGPCEMPN